MDSDTYYKDEIVLKPGHDYILGQDNAVISETPYFNWFYTPEQISFETALESYESLLTEIIRDQLNTEKVILPLSGGLDSRSQALVLKRLGNSVTSYSYSFAGGYPEHKIAEKIARYCGFEFKGFKIKQGYLWDCIDQLAAINKCYSEFTHPRQVAVIDELRMMNGIFSLGHWGDVLFDRGVPKGTSKSEIITVLFKKMVRSDGLHLASELWEFWDLDGDFEDYLMERIQTSLSNINIDNLSAKVRAFKTTQWAHRWTTTNLSFFEAAAPITLPYYDDRMCEFVCRIPEKFLADRRLQLAHLKTDKGISNITWHEQKPYSINNYHLNHSPFNLPYRAYSKAKRTISKSFGRPLIQRNFELQFLGEDNDSVLKSYLFNSKFNEFVPKKIVYQNYNRFKGKDYVNNAHAISMLLTLSVWDQNFNETID